MQWMWAQYWSLWSRLHLSVWVWAVVLPLIVERNRSLSHEDFVGKVDAAWKAWLGDHPGVLPGLKLRVLASAARVVLLKQSEIEQVLRSSNRSLRKSGFSTQDPQYPADSHRPGFRNPHHRTRRIWNAGYRSQRTAYFSHFPTTPHPPLRERTRPNREKHVSGP